MTLKHYIYIYTDSPLPEDFCIVLKEGEAPRILDTAAFADDSGIELSNASLTLLTKSRGMECPLCGMPAIVSSGES